MYAHVLDSLSDRGANAQRIATKERGAAKPALSLSLLTGISRTERWVVDVTNQIIHS